jgi:hypothetical protein
MQIIRFDNQCQSSRLHAEGPTILRLIPPEQASQHHHLVQHLFLSVPVALVAVPGPAAELVGSYPTPAVDPAPALKFYGDPVASAAYPEP